MPPRIACVRGWPLPLVMGGALSATVVLVLLFLFDPARHAIYPVCLFKRLTGYDCPGCGGLRAVHHLLHGDLWQAFRLNPLVVIALPLLGLWAIRGWLRSPDRTPSRKSPARFWPWLLLAVVVLFGILRNLPFWPFGVTPM